MPDIKKGGYLAWGRCNFQRTGYCSGHSDCVLSWDFWTILWDENKDGALYDNNCITLHSPKHESNQYLALGEKGKRKKMG